MTGASTQPLLLAVWREPRGREPRGGEARGGEARGRAPAREVPAAISSGEISSGAISSGAISSGEMQAEIAHCTRIGERAIEMDTLADGEQVGRLSDHLIVLTQ